MKIDSKIYEYCATYSIKDDEIMDELIQYTYDNKEAPNMISGNMVGNLLCILAKSIDAQRTLDIGMFTGYSALKLASAIPDNGEVHTFELAENHIQTAKKFFTAQFVKSVKNYE